MRILTIRWIFFIFFYFFITHKRTTKRWGSHFMKSATVHNWYLTYRLRNDDRQSWPRWILNGQNPAKLFIQWPNVSAGTSTSTIYLLILDLLCLSVCYVTVNECVLRWQKQQRFGAIRLVRTFQEWINALMFGFSFKCMSPMNYYEFRWLLNHIIK